VHVEHGGSFKLLLDFTANERFVDNVFDYNKCRLTFKADGQELFDHEDTREGGKAFYEEFNRDWASGDHQLTVGLPPRTPAPTPTSPPRPKASAFPHSAPRLCYGARAARTSVLDSSPLLCTLLPQRGSVV